MMVGERSSINRHPFTATQWKELELQTLIFNYMASGIPIPSHLILPFRRSFYFLDHFPLHPAMNSGRKTEHDLEPGRCRRTDGKKWRCSKEASPDSKYCERHMHRGKKCSRKQVEMPLITPTPTPTPNYYSHISSTSPYPPPLSMYSYSSHSKTQSFLGFSHQNNTTHLYLGTASYSPPDKSSRYYNGSKEDVNENTNFFSEESREERDSSWWFRPLGMSSLGEPKQSTYSYFSKDQIKEEEQNQHCFVMGTDLKLEKSVKVEREEETQRPKPLLCFFNECPEKNKDSCMDSEEWGSPDVYSKTQLSISIPR